MRKALLRFLTTPSAWFQKVYLQNFAIIQPVDLLPDGRMSMCEGCTDITVHDRQLYWSCRLEEIKKFGTFVTAVPKKELHQEHKTVAANPETNKVVASH
jgi:hypothetical protein